MAMSALLVLGVASCKKNSDVQNSESKKGMVTTEFSAVSKEGGVRTSINGSDILWSKGDQIKIYAGTETIGNDFSIMNGIGTTSAKFKGMMPEAATAPYYAVYPSSLSQGIEGDNIKYNIPAEQAYVENSFATNTVPMAAYSASDMLLAFKNQTAFIKLQLTGAGTIETMEIESASNNICGTFSVSKTEPTATSTAVEGAKKITVTNINGTALDVTTPKNVIIALAPADFAADDLTLSITASDGKAFTTTLGGFNVGRSQGKSVAVEVEFKAQTKGTAKRSGNIDVKWVQLWENGPKWAEYNVGASAVGEYGDYYAWGGKTNMSVSDYLRSNTNLSGDDDTATYFWGDNWQMPTKKDFENLIANCEVTEYYDSNKYEGSNGVLFTGKGDYSSNSVFFPTAGYYNGSKFVRKGAEGTYWSSTSYNTSVSYFMDFGYLGTSYATPYVGSLSSANGRSVRAVLNEGN